MERLPVLGQRDYRGGFGAIRPLETMAELGASGVIRLLQALVNRTPWLFVGTLAVMLFHPPDVDVLPLDRVFFVLLVFAVGLRMAVLRQPPNWLRASSWPMLGLSGMAFAHLISQPYNPQIWSLYAAKWLVPLVLFHLAGVVFSGRDSLRLFERFSLLTLAYLTFVAVAFWAGATACIFPGYILDESLGIHADRARGPFLQAVANGLSLNLLGLVALNSFRRGKLKSISAAILLGALPVAILATRTRAVWISFAGSIVVLLVTSSNRRLRRVCLALVSVGAFGGILLVSNDALLERLKDQGPVDYRMAVYQAGWEMVLERPLLGWGPSNVQPELWKRITGFQVDQFFFHNAYLEITVERGLVGLGLYLWLLISLLCLPRMTVPEPNSFLDAEFLCVWRVMVLVYALNACFVGMNYQFVNGYLFTVAGMLAARSSRQSLPIAV